MRYEDIDKAMSLKYDYDKLRRISDAMMRENQYPLYVAIWNNSECMELPSSVAEKLGNLIQREMASIKVEIEKL